MKLGPILLLNVLIAGGAVFSYHMVAGPAPATDNSGYEEDMSVDPEPIANVETDYVEEPALQGVGDEVYRKKVETLEKELASMKELLASLQVKGGSAAPSGSNGSSMPALEMPIVEEGEEDPEFTEDTLRSFRAMMEQVEQQRRDERIQEGLKRQLDRLGVELSEDQEQAVMKATLSFREKTRNMWRSLPRGADDESRDKRREAMEGMREEYSKTVYSLVPAADAEKIVNSMGRGMGFSPRMRGGDGNSRRGR
ncbi:MAG: hypothetical protein QNJ98_20200 [Planctomycetota bacterium]|nr:hypothetical protein [Planctomycetota bacterium]